MTLQNSLTPVALLYRQCVDQSGQAYNLERPKSTLPAGAWIGLRAESLFKKKVQFLGGVRLITTEPLTCVSNLGNPRRADMIAMIDGRTLMVELKKSEYGGDRARYQKAAQIFDLGSGTWGAQTLCRISADDGLVQCWSREQAEKAVQSAYEGGEFNIPEPSLRFAFGPDLAKVSTDPKERLSAL